MHELKSPTTTFGDCFASVQPGSKFVSLKIELPKLGKNEIQIKVTHVGICHSDLHMHQNDWKITQYPFIPGHEIVGIVINRGTNVNKFSIGDRAGVGWYKNSCQQCKNCISGYDYNCENKAQLTETIVGKGNYGGFASMVNVPAEYAFHIPTKIKSIHAAPLLCSGLTVYKRMKHHIMINCNCKQESGLIVVAIVGIGSLGHLAIQFAKAMDCYVIGISSSKDKKQDVLKIFGADEFIYCDGYNIETILNEYNFKKKIDVIFVTTSIVTDCNPDCFNQLLKMLKENGTLCIMGGKGKVININTNILTHNSLNICGNCMSGRTLMKEMLQFCEKYQIKPNVELIPKTLNGVNQAMEKLKNKEVRYNIVLSSQLQANL